MKKNNKIMLVGGLLAIAIIITSIFVFIDLYEYLVIAFPFTIIIGIWFIYEIIHRNTSDEDTYNKTLSKITRMYDPILVNTDTFPKLNSKSILKVKKFNDLVDAQAEMRKPIYFVIGIDSTAFYLINDDVLLIYFLKIDNNKECELEIELKRVEIKGSLNLDAIKDFDKTVVVKANNKSYKVSPIREKKDNKNEEKNINNSEIENINETKAEDVEIEETKTEESKEAKNDDEKIDTQTFKSYIFDNNTKIENTKIEENTNEAKMEDVEIEQTNAEESKEEIKDKNDTRIEKESWKKNYNKFINFYKNLVAQDTDFSNLTLKQKKKFQTLLRKIEETTENYSKYIVEFEKQEIDKILEKIKENE